MENMTQPAPIKSNMFIWVAGVAVVLLAVVGFVVKTRKKDSKPLEESK